MVIEKLAREEVVVSGITLHGTLGVPRDFDHKETTKD